MTEIGVKCFNNEARINPGARFELPLSTTVQLDQRMVSLGSGDMLVLYQNQTRLFRGKDSAEWFHEALPHCIIHQVSNFHTDLFVDGYLATSFVTSDGFFNLDAASFDADEIAIPGPSSSTASTDSDGFASEDNDADNGDECNGVSCVLHGLLGWSAQKSQKMPGTVEDYAVLDGLAGSSFTYNRCRRC